MAGTPKVKDGKRFNIYLPRELKRGSDRLARRRYRISTSEMIARLLVRERKHRKGLVHAKPRELGR